MVGASLVVLWSVYTSINNPGVPIALAPIPVNSRATEIIISPQKAVNAPKNPFQVSIGLDPTLPNSLINEMYVNGITYSNYETYDITSNYQGYIPANTIEYLSLAGAESNAPTGVTVEVLGYAVPVFSPAEMNSNPRYK